MSRFQQQIAITNIRSPDAGSHSADHALVIARLSCDMMSSDEQFDASECAGSALSGIDDDVPENYAVSSLCSSIDIVALPIERAKLVQEGHHQRHQSSARNSLW